MDTAAQAYYVHADVLRWKAAGSALLGLKTRRLRNSLEKKKKNLLAAEEDVCFALLLLLYKPKR